MSDDNFQFQSPSEQDMRVIRQAMPDIQSEAGEHQKKHVQKVAAKAGVKPGDKLCSVCAEVIKINNAAVFAFSHLDGKPEIPVCSICKSRLDKGETALITLDGRYMFGVLNPLAQAALIAHGKLFVNTGSEVRELSAETLKNFEGQIIGITPELMDLLEVKFKAQKDVQKSEN